MGKRAAELWERGQELDGSAEELWERLVARNKRLDWDREAIARELGLLSSESDTQTPDDNEQ